MKRAIFTWILLCSISMGCISTVQAISNDNVQITGSTASGSLQEEVTITFTLKNQTETGFVSGIWEYTYNPAYLQCTKVEETSLLDKAYTTTHIDNTKGVVRVVGIENHPNTQSGNIATLHFTIQKQAVEPIPVTVRVVELKDKAGNTISSQVIQPAIVTTTKPLKGDINADGNITLYDAFKILEKAILGGSLTVEETYIMDYNNDNKVSLYDAFKFLEIAILG